MCVQRLELLYVDWIWRFIKVTLLLSRYNERNNLHFGYMCLLRKAAIVAPGLNIDLMQTHKGLVFETD